MEIANAKFVIAFGVHADVCVCVRVRSSEVTTKNRMEQSGTESN